MRLVCPNCGAQYEIDASLVPPSGRDVQCSNCGHGWFEPGQQSAVEPEVEAPEFHPDDRLHDAARRAAVGGVVPNAAPPAQPTPSAEAEMDALLQALDAAVDAENPTGPPKSPVMDIAKADFDTDLWADEADQPRPLNAPRPSEDAMEILRAEAAREAAARRAEAELQARVEDQAEFDMTAPRPRTRPEVDPYAAMGAPHDEMPFADATEEARLAAAAQVAGQTPGGRTGRFPDIEDVSAHLGDTAQSRGKRRRTRAPLSAEQLADRYTRRKGMRIGFASVAALAAVAVGLYGQAPAVVSQVPALAEPLEGYVDWVNGMRFWVDRAARAAARMMLG